MGRKRLLTVLTATVLSVGAMSLPATALEIGNVVEDTTSTTTDTVETAETVASNTAALPAGSEATDEAVSTVTETVETAEPVEETVDQVVETVEQVVETVEETLPGSVEDLTGPVEDLTDPVTDPLLPSDPAGDNQTADDGDVEPATEPEPADRAAAPGNSPSPSFDHMLTLPSLDHGASSGPHTARPQVAAAAPADTSYDSVELAPEVAVQAAAPQDGPIGVPAGSVPALLRVLTAALVAGAAATWRTVQKQVAD